MIRPRRRNIKALATLLELLLASGAAAPAAAESLSHGRFERVIVSRPAGEVKGVALLLSGGGGSDPATRRSAKTLEQAGALVIIVDVPALLASFERDGASCVYPDGDLENLGRYVEAYERLPAYEPPLLVGSGAGATLAYAMIAQAPPGTFAGAISLGFCPVLPLVKPLCTGEGVRFTVRKDGTGVDLQPSADLRAPWLVLPRAEAPPCDAATGDGFLAHPPGAEPPATPRASSGRADESAALAAAFGQLAARATAASVRPPAEISDLPTVEVPAERAGDTFAVMLSGDGGWAGIDKDLATAFSKAAVAVVGLDSLRYFWTARTPESTAADVDRLIRFYAARWRRPRALLVGYSQGADVLPFVVNRLPGETLARLRLVALLGLGKRADFEFHLSSWLTSGSGGLPIAPEAARLPPGLALCVYGADDDESGCPGLDPGRIRSVRVPGGHHFGGDYARLATMLLEAAAARP